jgi:hypothetical protein
MISGKIRSLFGAAIIAAFVQQASAQTSIKVMDTVLFFDGYAAAVSSPTPPAGVLRLRNDLYTRKLTTAELSSIGTQLTLNVTIKAACDNYDRIGNVNIAFVPKGQSSYKPDSVQHIEIGRFITPFMNKNNSPTEVPYTWRIDNVANLLKETSLNASYDVWLELQVFGVPYAAQTQVTGCSGRNDVFYGSLELVTDNAVADQSNNVLVPLNFQKNLNNYEAKSTDTVGSTTRTLSFNLTTPLSDAAFFLITSNHGANTGGEEYNRRLHYVYFDDNLIYVYMPGRLSCEPLRKYNTQANGIYGSSPRSDETWQSFSNWCPGDTIPTRRFDLGPLAAGAHKFMIRVPDAVFAAGQGNIPTSLYLQGKTSGKLTVKNIISGGAELSIFPNPSTGVVTLQVNGADRMKNVTVLNTVGAVVFQKNGLQGARERIELSGLVPGLYTVHVATEKGFAVQKLEIL